MKIITIPEIHFIHIFKKNIMKKSIGIMVLALLVIVLGSAFKSGDKPKPWIAPEAAAAKKNPVAASASSISDGKELYDTHCSSCHGKKGKGDGSKAAQLETDPGDLTAAVVQKDSDGSLFYKIQTGRDDMPSFKKKIPDANDIWNVVNYVRSLKK